MDPFSLVASCIGIAQICQRIIHQHAQTLQQLSLDVDQFSNDLLLLHETLQKLSPIVHSDKVNSNSIFTESITTIRSEFGDLSGKLAEFAKHLDHPHHERQAWKTRRKSGLAVYLNVAVKRVLSRCTLLAQSWACQQQAHELDRNLIVHGVAGLGKTQLALEYISRQRDHSMPSIFWISNNRTGTNTLLDAAEKSKQCYAYLQDLRTSESAEIESNKSAWFTRAWTLQELRAREQVQNERASADHDWSAIKKYQRISRVKNNLSDLSAWLSWQAGNPALRRVWGSANYGSTGSLDRPAESKHKARWVVVFDNLFENTPDRHFAKRAALCIRGSLQRLTPAQLFVGATMKVKMTDPEWSINVNRSSVSLTDQFLELCSSFLELDEQGYVCLKDRNPVCEWHDLEWPRETAIHALLARICLKTLDEYHHGAILRPWHHFREALQMPSSNPLHVYARLYWPTHYRHAECTSIELPQYLHRLINSAWISDAAEDQGLDYATLAIDIKDFDSGTPLMIAAQQGQNEVIRMLLSHGVDINVHAEAIEVGYRLCENNGFDRLATIYHQMGAGKNTRLIDRLFANDVSELYYENFSASTREKLFSDGMDASQEPTTFDMRDWHFVEPLDTSGMV